MQYIGVDLAWGEGTATRPANETGLVAIDERGLVLEAGWARGLDEVIAWLQRVAEPGAVVAVDAPLVVLNGTGMRDCEREVSQRYGRWKVSANASNTAKADLAGVRLRQRLESLGFVYLDGTAKPMTTAPAFFECYPYTTLVGMEELGYDVERPRYKRQDLKLAPGERRIDRAKACDELVRRMARLPSALPPLDLDSHPVTRALMAGPAPLLDKEYKHREDLIDAALCAWTASIWDRYGEERTQVLGRRSPTDAGGRRATIVAPARREQRRNSPAVDVVPGPAGAPSDPGVQRLRESHVFVCKADLLHLACDAFLLPTDKTMNVTEFWQEVPELEAELKGAVSNRFLGEEIFATAASRDRGARPVPVFTAVPYFGAADDPGLLSQRVEHFLRVADQAAPVPGNGRPNRLFAMPSFGTSGGGGGQRKGQVLRILLETAQRVGAELGVDVALVLRDEQTFALAQEVRRSDPDAWWGALSADEQSEARALGELAKAGQLVPFLGAGVSVSAGAPTWADLISRIGEQLGLPSADLDELRQKDVLDQAAYLRAVHADKHVKGEPTFNQIVADLVSTERYGLAPTLIAAMGARQAITLNYDRLYEVAAEHANDPVRVIPDEVGEESAPDRWVLKLHGSVTTPESIVLTRDDYLGFNEERQALSALVKATLITHHLLFVGFGLKDDHFHEIVHDVGRALGDRGVTTTRATALTLFRSKLDERLWAGKLRLLPMAEPSAMDVLAAARKLEIFLDALLASSTDSHSYLLSSPFASSLSEVDAALRERLLELSSRLDPELAASPSWVRVVEFLESLGWSNPQR
jgi:predicted RNase H-like nuclease